MKPRFEEHEGKFFRMLEKPVPLTPDAEMPCLVRLIQDDSPMGINCPSCGGGCDPVEHEYVGCGKDSFSRSPHSWVWVDDEWMPLCEECSAIELASSDNLIRCNKCHRILDRLMETDNGCMMCIFDDIRGITRQINKALLDKLNKVIEQSLK